MILRNGTFIADRALARRAERADASRSLACAQARAALLPEGDTSWTPIAGGYAVFAGDGSPLNKGVGFGADESIGVAELEALEKFYQGNRTAAAFDLAPFADGRTLELIARRGYGISYLLNVLALDPSSPPESLQPAPGYRAWRAGAAEEDIWVRTVAAGFAGGKEPSREALALFTAQFHAATAHCFLAGRGGEIAGAGMISIDDGTGLLGATSVLPRHRGRGIHGMLLRERLLHAHAYGCGLAVTSTAPGSPSQRNLQRYGFRILYTKALMRRLPP